MAQKTYTWKKSNLKILLSPNIYIQVEKLGKKGNATSSTSNMQQERLVGTIVYPGGQEKIDTTVSIKKINLFEDDLNKLSKISINGETLVDILQKNSGFIAREVDKALGLK